MIRRMGRAKRNPSSWPVIARGVMGFASLYPSYARDQAAVGGSGSGGAPVAPPPIVPTIASASSVSENGLVRSEEHTSELQSLMRISYAVFCLKKNNNTENKNQNIQPTHN